MITCLDYSPGRPSAFPGEHRVTLQCGSPVDSGNTPRRTFSGWLPPLYVLEAPLGDSMVLELCLRDCPGSLPGPLRIISLWVRPDHKRRTVFLDQVISASLTLPQSFPLPFYDPPNNFHLVECACYKLTLEKRRSTSKYFPGQDSPCTFFFREEFSKGSTLIGLLSLYLYGPR